MEYFDDLSTPQKAIFDSFLHKKDILVSGFQQTGKSLVHNTILNFCFKNHLFPVKHLDHTKDHVNNVLLVDDSPNLNPKWIRKIKHKRNCGQNIQVIVFLRSHTLCHYKEDSLVRLHKKSKGIKLQKEKCDLILPFFKTFYLRRPFVRKYDLSRLPTFGSSGSE